MLRNWSALSLLLASVCLILLAHRSVMGSDAAQEVDLCTLALAPQDYAGRLVKVHGVVSFGFEESAFTSSNCYARLWIAIPDEHGQVTDKPPAGTRVIFGASFDQFREWSNAGVLADPGNLPWQIAEAGKPVKIVRNRRWRQFTKIGWDCPTPATLIGRIDYLPGPGFIIPDTKHGFVWQSSGYGHLDAYPLRLVVTEVVAIENGKRCKEK
jgi:hypothetical protein